MSDIYVQKHIYVSIVYLAFFTFGNYLKIENVKDIFPESKYVYYCSRVEHIVLIFAFKESRSVKNWYIFVYLNFVYLV